MLGPHPTLSIEKFIFQTTNLSSVLIEEKENIYVQIPYHRDLLLDQASECEIIRELWLRDLLDEDEE